MGIEPHACLYFGNGSNHELTGALQVGMHPVLIHPPYEDEYDAFKINAEEWKGPTISTLRQVLELVD